MARWGYCTLLNKLQRYLRKCDEFQSLQPEPDLLCRGRVGVPHDDVRQKSFKKCRSVREKHPRLAVALSNQ